MFIGVWLGNPSTHHSEGKKVWIEGADQDWVRAAETRSYSAEKLAINLLTALYSLDELSTGSCTEPKKVNIKLLNQKKLAGIRRKFALSF